MPHESLSLDLWLLRQATLVALLAERRMLRPWRSHLLATARELQRRAVEAKRMRCALDEVVRNAQQQARRVETRDALDEFHDVVERWKRRET